MRSAKAGREPECRVCGTRATHTVPVTGAPLCPSYECYQGYWRSLNERAQGRVLAGSGHRLHTRAAASAPGGGGGGGSGRRLAFTVAAATRAPAAATRLVGQVIASVPHGCTSQSLRDYQEDVGQFRVFAGGRGFVAAVFDGHGGAYTSHQFLATDDGTTAGVRAAAEKDATSLLADVERIVTGRDVDALSARYAPLIAANADLAANLVQTPPWAAEVRAIGGGGGGGGGGDGQRGRIDTDVRNLFLLKDAQLRVMQAADPARDSGSTATVVTFLPADAGAGAGAGARPDQLLFAHVGDSSALFFDDRGAVVHATRDHGPLLADERRRIEAAGGQIFVEPQESEFSAAEGRFFTRGRGARNRDADGHPRVNMSRAFGDFSVKKRGVGPDAADDASGVRGWLSVEPDVVRVPVPQDRRSYLVVASDGMWNFITRGWVGGPENLSRNRVVFEMLRFLRSRPATGDRAAQLQTACQRLLHSALSNQEELGGGDNTTVVVVEFAPGRE